MDNMDFAFLICVSLTALLLHNCFGQDAETAAKPTASFQIKISPETQNLLYQTGNDRILTCKSSAAGNDTKPVLHWEINDIKVTATAVTERIRVESFDDNTLTLRVNPVTTIDGGDYKCVGTLGLETDSRTVKVEVYEPIKANFPLNQTGNLEQTGEISCNVTGSPLPATSWKFENHTKIVKSDKYDIDGNKLIIQNLSFADTGNYRCDAFVTQIGVSSAFVISFEVVKSPQIDSALEIDPSSPVVGKEVTVKCVAAGVPEPTYQFKRADNFLVEGHVDEKQGTLTISSLKQEDEGEYICVATNKGGVAEKSSFLDVKVAPIFKDMPTEVEAVEGDPKQVPCVAEGDPIPTISWQKEGMAVFEEDNNIEGSGPAVISNTSDDQDDASIKIAGKTLDFASIKPEDAGTYICRASSDVGSTSQAVKLNVKYKPTFKPNQETKFYGWEGHTANLTCLASANEIATFTFYRSNEDGTEELIESQSPYSLMAPQEWPSYHLSSRSLLVTIGSEDSGVYRDYICEASNAQGVTRQIISLTEAVPPSEPVIRRSSTLSTMVTLEIDTPADDGGQPVLSYRYSYFPTENDSDIQESSVDKTKNTTTVELRNLQAKTAYTLKISAQNAVGSGSEASFSFKTKEVSVPVQLNMTSARAGSEATSYNIVWSEPDDGGAPITKYIIKYKKVTVQDEDASKWEVAEDIDEEFEEESLDDSAARSYTIHNLDPGSYYSVAIIAVNKEGESSAESHIIKTSEKVETQATQAGEKEEVKDGKTGDTLGRDSGSDVTAGLDSGVIAAIIITLLVVILVVIIIIFLVFKKKPELVGRLRGHLGGKGGEEERGKKEDGKDPAEEEKLIKKDDTVKVENETEESKAEQVIDEHPEEFEPDSKPDAQAKPDTGAVNGTGEKPQDLGTPAPTTEIKITPETPEKPENPSA